MRYQITSTLREYDSRHELIDTVHGNIVRGPTYTKGPTPPSYMIHIQDIMNREAGENFGVN